MFVILRTILFYANIKNIKNAIWLPLAFMPIWYIIYHNLQPMTDWFIDTVLGMTKGAHLTEALRFFVFEFPKVMLLLTLIIFFESGLSSEEVMDLIPVKPIGEHQSQITEIYQTKLLGLFEKIKP